MRTRSKSMNDEDNPILWSLKSVPVGKGRPCLRKGNCGGDVYRIQGSGGIGAQPQKKGSSRSGSNQSCTARDPNLGMFLLVQLDCHQNNSLLKTRDEFQQMRQSVVEMVLVRPHFEYVAKFKEMALVDVEEEQRNQNSMTVCNMLVKCADVLNPTRKWSVCQKWAYRIVEEYFEQTREEKEKGLPITMEFFDKRSVQCSQNTVWFEMFVREAFACWGEFAHLSHLQRHLESNFEQWQKLSITWTPEDNVHLL